MSENLSRAEQRRLKREIKKLKKFEKQNSAKKSTMLKLAVGVLILITISVLWYLANAPEVPNNQTKVSILNRQHISNTDDVVYNSNPPTSGPHFSDWQKDWKFYDRTLPVGGLLHNMEHGGIVVWYKSSVDEATKALLKKFTEDNFKVIGSVNEDITTPIALSAWGVYELFETFDEKKFEYFYDENLNNGPENIYP